jgi:hypothetical protein
MQISRVISQGRMLPILALLGSLAFAAGCDGGNAGESNVAPATPPPGKSTKEMIEASQKSFGPNGIPPKQGASRKK